MIDYLKNRYPNSTLEKAAVYEFGANFEQDKFEKDCKIFNLHPRLFIWVS